MDYRNIFFEIPLVWLHPTEESKITMIEHKVKLHMDSGTPISVFFFHNFCIFPPEAYHTLYNIFPLLELNTTGICCPWSFSAWSWIGAVLLCRSIQGCIPPNRAITITLTILYTNVPMLHTLKIIEKDRKESHRSRIIDGWLKGL